MKLTEKMLFGTWLDIDYAKEDQEAFVSDLSATLKEAKTKLRKIVKLEKRAADHYERVSGKPPSKK